jgi:host factor-I protein
MMMNRARLTGIFRLDRKSEVTPGRMENLSPRGEKMEKTKIQVNIQDQFLNRVRRDRVRVSIELTTGRKLEGVILSFDNFSVLFRTDTDQLLYKHAISSVSVSGMLDLSETK